VLPKRPTQEPLGPIGEAHAALAYERRGASVLERNVRTKFGELELVVMEEGVLVGVEVKTRTLDEGQFRFGRPAEAVDGLRLGRLCRALTAVAARALDPPSALRIDVVEVTVDRERRLRDLRILENVTA
jgi:putative endonuclease